MRLGEQAGALLSGRDRGLRLLHANFDKMYESYIPGWLTMVDATGRRFVDETAPYGILDGLVRVVGDRVWVVFDRAALEYSSTVARNKQDRPTSSDKPSPHWNVDMVEAMVAEGKVHEAPTVAALAAAAGLPPATLEATVAKVNRWSELGEDQELGKDPKFLDGIRTPPYYAAELRPASVCWTAFGLRIDRDARVQSEAGCPSRAVRGGRVHLGRHRSHVRRERQHVLELRDHGPHRRCHRGRHGRRAGVTVDTSAQPFYCALT